MNPKTPERIPTHAPRVDQFGLYAEHEDGLVTVVQKAETSLSTSQHD